MEAHVDLYARGTIGMAKGTDSALETPMGEGRDCYIVPYWL